MADMTLTYPGYRASSRVRIAAGSLAGLGAFTRTLTGAPRVALVTDSRVGALWGAAAGRSLRAAGISVTTLVVPAGEGAKRAEVLVRERHATWLKTARGGA